MTVSRFILATLSAGLIAAPAMADATRLTSTEKATVTEACKTGLDLFPVQTDVGHQTGDYALPVKGENGAVNSALIVSGADLQAIPECKVDFEAVAERDTDSDDKRAS